MTHYKKLVCGAGALLFSGACMAQVFVATLDGDNLVPGPGDADASARAAAWIADGEFHVDILAEDIALPLTMANLHQAPAGVNGGSVLDLSALIDGAAVRGTMSIDPVLAAGIAADPAGFYLNIRNGDFPAGAVRGQLQIQPTTLLTAELLSENEVQDPPVPPGGTGSATVRLGAFAAAYDMTAENIDFPPVAYHIHVGPAGVNGPAVVAFDPSAWTGDASVASARGIVLADPGTVATILADPVGHYVNVHTAEFPAGEIRGQLGSIPAPTGAAAIPANAAWALLLLALALGAWGVHAARH